MAKIIPFERVELRGLYKEYNFVNDSLKILEEAIAKASKDKGLKKQQKELLILKSDLEQTIGKKTKELKKIDVEVANFNKELEEINKKKSKKNKSA